MIAQATTPTIEDDKERLLGALYRDIGLGAECMARSYLMRSITAERARGMLPNDTFDALVASAETRKGRRALLGMFGAPHLEEA